MKPIPFKDQTCVIAEDQPEYLPLPARFEMNGVVTSCWQLSWRDVWHLIWYGRKLWIQQYSCFHPLQAQLPSVVQPAWIEEWSMMKGEDAETNKE